jgi:membrane protein DedA with SNARE-associated domain
LHQVIDGGGDDGEFRLRHSWWGRVAWTRLRAWFQKYGDKVIFISRLLPAVRTVISLPAGVFRMNLKKFIIYTTVGCFLWSVLLTYLGYVMGENWRTLDVYYRKFEYVIFAIIIFGVIFYVYRKIKKG